MVCVFAACPASLRCIAQGFYSYFLSSGADVSAQDKDSCTPLLTAATHGQAGALKKLLKRSASIEDRDKDGKSVVFLAAKENHNTVLAVRSIHTIIAHLF